LICIPSITYISIDMVHSKMMKTTKRAVVDTTGQRKEPSSFSQDCQIVEMATDGALTN